MKRNLLHKFSHQKLLFSNFMNKCNYFKLIEKPLNFLFYQKHFTFSINFYGENVSFDLIFKTLIF